MLPPCEYRAEVGRHLVCRHARVRGYPLGIVAPQTCQRCVWREVPCAARPLPRWLGVKAWLVGLRLGDALKRALAAATWGLVRPRPGCGCDRRRIALNRVVQEWLNRS